VLFTSFFMSFLKIFLSWRSYFKNQRKLHLFLKDKTVLWTFSSPWDDTRELTESGPSGWVTAVTWLAHFSGATVSLKSWWNPDESCQTQLLKIKGSTQPTPWHCNPSLIRGKKERSVWFHDVSFPALRIPFSFTPRPCSPQPPLGFFFLFSLLLPKWEYKYVLRNFSTTLRMPECRSAYSRLRFKPKSADSCFNSSALEPANGVWG
jgi:hypothetical protein